MKLYEILKLMDHNRLPLEVKEKEIDSRPSSGEKITICFMSERETWLTCHIENEILVPWYDCEVYSIGADPFVESICIWLDDVEYLKRNYPEHIDQGSGQQN